MACIGWAVAWGGWLGMWVGCGGSAGYMRMPLQGVCPQVPSNVRGLGYNPALPGSRVGVGHLRWHPGEEGLQVAQGRRTGVLPPLP